MAKKRAPKGKPGTKVLRLAKETASRRIKLNGFGLPFLPGDSYSREKAECDLVTAGKAAGKKAGNAERAVKYQYRSQPDARQSVRTAGPDCVNYKGTSNEQDLSNCSYHHGAEHKFRACSSEPQPGSDHGQPIQ